MRGEKRRDGTLKGERAITPKRWGKERSNGEKKEVKHGEKGPMCVCVCLLFDRLWRIEEGAVGE